MRRSTLPPIACRVADTLIARGHHGVIVTQPAPTPTVADAARALGVEVGAITTAAVFLLDEDPVLLLVSGAHEVDLTVTGKRLEGTLTPAPAELVRQVTGQPIGGVAPVGHPTNLPTWVDSELSRHREVWAAGGHPNTVFRTSFHELVRITAGLPIDVV
ncbi:YbaK/EbsC family protein [Nocardia brasiliensis]|uniref:YbaK/EbsC family protein n=1 Tax=Nocardia brasiliensis TaxID=37326 RepID=UPI0004A6FA82|nr:YbaK/EbsC family protein [Nocardia brasiliensis]MBF6128873.1 YbaK/EbsC family protein [Nocardia brasiliensis]MBF6545853.1 YbaK/EbsC family protein [Nocardia brasiliensis]